MLPIFDITTLSEAARTESYTYATAVAISRDGTELRAPRREHPRLSLSLSVVVSALAHPALTALRNGNSVLMPLWFAPMRRTGDVYVSTDLPAAESEYVVRRHLDGSYSAVRTELYGQTPADDSLAAWPAYEMRQSASSSTASSTTTSVHTIPLSLETTAPFERYSPPARTILPPDAPAAFAHNFSTALGREWANDELVFDAGGIATREVRYQKRLLTLSMLLADEEIQAFREFVHEIQGAARPFALIPPGEVKPRLFRLASDVVHIQHRCAGVATTSLTLVELPVEVQ